MAKKVRVNVYVRKENWNRLKAVIQDLGGTLTLSGIVDDYVAQIAPVLEDVLRRAREGDKEAMLALFDSLIASNVATLGVEHAALHKALKEEGGTGDDS